MLLSLLALLAHAAPGHRALDAKATAAAQCQYLITPGSQSFAARGGPGSLGILAAPGCAWTASSNVSWITVVSNNTGSAAGRINYSVLPYTGASTRTGMITVGGQVFTVNQAGTSPTSCEPSAISSGQTINGALTSSSCFSPLRVKGNARPLAARYSFNGTVGQSMSVSLSSPDFDTYLLLVDPNGSVIAQNDDSVGGGSRIPGNDGFFILPANGTYIIEVTTFAKGAIGRYAVNLSMPAGNCTYALGATGQAFASGGGSGTVNVTTQEGCAWEATSNNGWLTLSGAGGSGAGAVSFTVGANSGAARTGSLTIAGQTFTITQAGTNGTGCPTITAINPASGAPGSTVTITGTNFTGASGVRFGGNVAAQFAIISDTQATATVPNGAASGPLALIKPACPDAQSESFTVNRLVVSVSAASFLGPSLASQSIVAAFGTAMATDTSVAATLPLPTDMLGTTVWVRDSAGAERLAPLFFVAPTQINYQIPEGTQAGTATITVTSGDGTISMGVLEIGSVAPGLFSANASGLGVAAANVLRVKSDGAQIIEEAAVFDPANNRFVTTPIDFGPDLGTESDQLFLILYGTGVRFRSTQAAVTCSIGGANAEVLYAGAQGIFQGLDQINVRMPRSLIGRGEVDVLLIVDGKATNSVRINIK